MRTETLTAADEGAYADLLLESPHSLVYTSLKYRELLRRNVDGEDFYLIAKEADEVVGALPLFLKKNPKNGNVLNSLPFYGSTGGFVISPRVSDHKAVIRALTGTMDEIARATDAMSATIVTSPLDRLSKDYDEYLQPAFREGRTGQVATLAARDDDAEDAVMAMAHSKTRNMVRKARSQGVKHHHSLSPETLGFLATTHQENISAVGGIAKSDSFFRSVTEVFEYDTDYRLYYATLDGHLISALLVLYFNQTAEYFTPATVAEYRSLQPNSLLIFQALKDAQRSGLTYWNFGGTWNTQHGLYHFKRRWGAEDMPYHYHVKQYRDMEHLREMTQQDLLAEYPYFYILPFSVLDRSPSRPL